MSISLRRNSSARTYIVRLSAVLLLLLLGGGFWQAQAAGITLVQHVGKDAGTTTTSTLAFASPNTAGNFVAVVIRGGLSSSQVFTVTDSNGNTYKQAAQIGFAGSAVTDAIYYAENIKGGANTITASMTVSGPLRFAILEYSGVATSNSLDAAVVATATSTAPNSGNATTTVSGDLLLGSVGTADSVAFTAGTSYTLRDSVPAPPGTKLISEDQIQAAAGIVSASATLSPSSSWGAILAAFKPAGGVAGVPATITATAGTPQSAAVNTAFATQLQATVKDSFNNPVSGAVVTFAAPGSGASGTFAGGVTTATTNASGVATAAVFTANTTAGSYTVTASVSGVSSPANFLLTNLAGSASAIAATAGTPQSAAVNAAFATQLQATVKDSFGNGVSGVTVTFAAPGSGASGTFAGGVTTATTNASGVATAAVFTANTTAGAYIVTASASGVGTQASFSLTNLAGAANNITATAGTPQSATVNTAFATQLQATVKDSFNNPVNGVTVTFAAPASGASGTFAGGVKTATTNASGVATAAVFTANTTAGVYTVTASVSGVGTSASFSMTNLAGSAASIAATTGTPQSASINTAFATQLQATVKDSFGNGVSAVTVTFAAPGSGASGTFAAGVNTATTNASGVATAAVFTANATAGGPYTVTASASGVSGSASFSLTNLGNPPANIAATAGTPQSATINTAFAAQLQVTVTDSGNNPVNGVTVTFAAPGSGASGAFTGGVNTATTNASGVATSAVFTANSTAGSYTVTASVSGVASPANFSMTNLAGAANNITATAGTPQSATINSAFATQFQATVKDAGGNLVSGVTVTFTVPGSGASGTFAGGVNTATTNASGVATATMFTANTTAGAYNVTASVSGVGTQASFSLTNLAGSAASIAATAGTPQSATVNTAFASQLQATVKDSFNNPVSGVTVTFTAPVSGASGTFAGGVNTATTNASGVATSVVFTANAVAGGPYTVSAAVSGVGTPASFSLTNTASVAAPIVLVQHIGKDAGTTTTSTLAFASANTAGDFIAVAIRGGLSSAQVFTVSDSNSNTYKQAKQIGYTGSTVTSAIYYAENIKGGANTITVTMSVSGPLRFAILEYSGVATSSSLDGTSAATNTSASPNSGNLTTTASGDLLFSTVATADSVTFTAGSGFTVRDVVPTTGSKMITQDQVQSAAGTASASATLSASSAWGALLAAFKAAGGAGGAGIPASIAATAGTPQSATVSSAFAAQLQATVKDSLNNPVSGVTVTFAAPGSGASGTFAGGVTTATTNASGVATAAVFTANTAAGSYTVTASVSGVSTAANFSLTNLAGAASSIAATAGTPQTASINTAFATQLQATVKDSFGNVVSGVTVTFAAPGSGASGTFAGGVTTATTNASGVATAAVFTANGTAGGPYTVTASVSGVGTSAAFSLTNSTTPQPNITSLSPTAGPVGTSVTISGANFGSTGTVTFNNTTASPTNWTNTSIVVPVPSGATTGSVVVTVGGVASNGVTFTVTTGTGNIKFVQTASLDAGTTTSASLAFSSTNTAGNWIAVCIRGGSSGAQVFTVSDSNGNTYQQAFVTGVNGTITFATYYAENIKGGSNTIHVSDTISGPLRFAILEYSGVATSNSLDAAPVTNVGTSTSMNSGTLTTGANGDLLLASFITNNAASFTVGSGYATKDFVPVEPNSKLFVEDTVQPSAGSASASATLAAADNWGASLVAFRSASGIAVPISVGISPTSASVPSGYGSQGFTVSVANDYRNLGVTFALTGAGCSGSTCGTLSNVTSTSVTYSSPANVPSPATVTLTATSVADTTKSASATITVTQGVLTVVVSPRRAGVTLSASQTIQFTDTVYNDPQNLGVTWQVDGNNGGNTTTGTISATGLFTPGTQPGAHTVTAVSNVNASVSTSALMAVTDLLGVYTHHNDNARTGQNLQEYGLTPATITPTTFGQLFSCPVDGYVYAQPLWVANLTINGGVHNVVYVATENDSIFAFDADSPSCVQLWKVSFLSTGVTPPTPNDFSGNLDVGPLFGMTSTPVIDPATNTLYLVAWTKEAGGLVHRLHALDLVSGAEKFGGPVVISAPSFTSAHHMQRPALLLANKTVYLAFASVGDQCPYWGWVMGYDASTLAQVFAKPLTNPASGCGLFQGGPGAGGVWQAGAGPAADASGNVYVSTGNGLYDGTSNWADSAVKLSPTGSILDWFTPFNQGVFQANDIDLASAGIVILPSSVGSAAHPNLAIATGKVAILYLLDVGNCTQPCTTMGKFNSGSNHDVQEVTPVPPPNTTLADGGNYSDVAYWNGNIYTTGQNFPLSQFTIANGVIATPQASKSSNMFPPRGGVPDVSANGTTGGVVWIIDYNGWQTNAPAILDAYDATNVGNLLYSSPASGTGAAGLAVKFTVPTVANSKVYVGGQSSLTVYGLLP